MLDMNMSCDPSGDQAGEELVPLKARPGNQLVGQHGINADLRGQHAAAAAEA